MARIVTDYTDNQASRPSGNRHCPPKKNNPKLEIEKVFENKYLDRNIAGDSKQH